MLFVENKLVDVRHQSPTYIVGLTKTETMYINKSKSIAQFDGVDTALRYVQKHMPKAKSHASSSSRGSSGSWSAFKSYDECIDTFTHHPEKVRTFTEKDTQLGGGDADGLQVNYDVTGDFIDIDRVITGQPENFGSMYDGKPRGKRVYFIIGGSWNCSVKQESINLRSKRLVRLIDWLEMQGIRTQILAVDSTNEGHVEVMVKHFDDPVNLNDIAVVSHSDWLRRIVFRIQEYGIGLSANYGSSTVFNVMMRDRFKPSQLKDYDPNAIYIYVGNYAPVINSEFDHAEKRLTAILNPSDENHDKEVKALEIDNNYIKIAY